MECRAASAQTHRNSYVLGMRRLSLLLMLLTVKAMAAYGAGNKNKNGNWTTMLGRTGAMVPAVIAFGDSLIDAGNNNGLLTTAKCNFPPYGQDFVTHKPTGRFSNGLIPGDLIASSLGVKELLPPYLGVDLSPQDILTGVTLASGGAGFDPLTSKIPNVFSMTDQLKLFAEYKQKVYEIAGEERGAEIISQALILVCAGTDDIMNTYFSTPFRMPHFDIPSYVDFVISYASDFIKQLVGMGAGKVGFVGIAPFGCVPSQRTIAGGIYRQCEASRNQAAQLFNFKIQEEIQRISGEFGGTKLIIYLDIYSIVLNLIQRPAYYGFKESTKGCCGTGLIEVTALCNSKTATACSDVTEYVFWDSYHPTEKAYRIIVDYLLNKYLKFIV